LFGWVFCVQIKAGNFECGCQKTLKAVEGFAVFLDEGWILKWKGHHVSFIGEGFKKLDHSGKYLAQIIDLTMPLVDQSSDLAGIAFEKTDRSNCENVKPFRYFYKSSAQNKSFVAVNFSAGFNLQSWSRVWKQIHSGKLKSFVELAPRVFSNLRVPSLKFSEIYCFEGL